jgi:hypothetical protein
MHDHDVSALTAGELERARRELASGIQPYGRFMAGEFSAFR